MARKFSTMKPQSRVILYKRFKLLKLVKLLSNMPLSKEWRNESCWMFSAWVFLVEYKWINLYTIHRRFSWKFVRIQGRKFIFLTNCRFYCGTQSNFLSFHCFLSNEQKKLKCTLPRKINFKVQLVFVFFIKFWKFKDILTT